MEDWDDYRLILALHRHRTLRGTADALAINHSTVSRRLSQINHKYRKVLFERTTAGYQMTSAAEPLLQAAQEMERVILSATRQARAADDRLQGRVTLSLPGAIGQFLLLRDLAQFHLDFPGIQLKVTTGYHFADLDKSEADVVVRATAHPSEHLVGRRLFPYYLCLYANKTYFEHTPRDQLRWITAPFAGAYPPWLQQTDYGDIPVAMVLDDVVMRHNALVDGLGLVRDACYLADPEPEVMRLPGAVPIPQFEMWVLTHPDLRDSPKINAVMGFLADALRQKRSLIMGEL